MKKVLICLLTIVSLSCSAQITSNYYDQYGRSVGSSTTNSNYGGGTTTTYYDQYGRSIGSSTTNSNYGGGTTTTYYDQYGRSIGTKTNNK